MSTISSSLSTLFLIRDLFLLPWHAVVNFVLDISKQVWKALSIEVVVVTDVEVEEDTNKNFPSLKISFINSFLNIFFITNF